MAEAEPDPSASSSEAPHHTRSSGPPGGSPSQDIMEVTAEDTAEAANSSTTTPGMKQSISHTNSLPGSQHLSPVNEQEPKPNVFKHQSFRIRRGPEATAASKSTRWSFGGMAKAVGTGVTAFGSGVVQGTKAVGSGVVSGTTAVASGVVEGTKAVGTGISEGTKIVGDTVVSGGKAVGSGVVQGTKAVGTGVAVVANTTKDVTLAAGNKVVEAGDIAITSVSDAGKATTKAMKRVMNESLGEDDLHVVLPDENLECLAEKYGVSKRDLIRVNSLNRRSLRAGQELIIPHAGDIHEERIHPHEILVMNATNEHDQAGVCRFDPTTVIWSIDGEEKDKITLDNVKHIWIDMQRDIPPELLPVIGERSSVCQPANNKNTPGPPPHLPPETEIGGGGNGSDKISNNNTKTAEATVVELPPPPTDGDVDPGSSPDEDWDDDHTSVRVDFHIFCNKPEKEVCQQQELDENDEVFSSSENDENTDAKVTSDLKIDLEDQSTAITTTTTTSKSFRFDRTDLGPLSSYLELWWAELLQMSSQMRNFLQKQRNLDLNFSAFNDPFRTNTLDSLEDPGSAAGVGSALDHNLVGLGAGLGPQILNNAKSEILEAMHFKQLFAQLPPKTQNQPWTLSYSTQEQGFSLRNLYRSVSTTDDNKLLRQMSHSPGSVTSASACSGSGDPDSESSPCLLIIQNMDDNRIFGGFLTCTPCVTETFVGTGKSWLFAFGGRTGRKLRVYKWSGQNEHFFRGTTDSFIIGADEGRFGILIDGDLNKGRIQECNTFSHWPDKSLEEDFAIRCLEVWTFES